jgi:hypothetical protein
MTNACTQFTDRECKEDDCCMLDFKFKLEVFNIPVNIKHDHTPEALVALNEGIEKVNYFLSGLHEDCVKHLVTYAELNIRAFFLFHLTDKDALKAALNLFIKNLNFLFIKYENPVIGTDP